LSLKNMGAKSITGFDISEAFLEQANRLAGAAGLDAQFICTDAYSIPESFNHCFDLIYISIGTLGWMPDIRRFFQTLARLLATNGYLFIYEMHPVTDMLEPGDKEYPPVLRYSYFHNQPYIDEDGLDYYGGSQYDSPKTYWFHHKMSDIISGCLENGFRLLSFDELDYDISNTFENYNHLAIRPPLAYSLLAQKSEMKGEIK
jgi:SAM-dependent methyltransferase